MAITLHAYLASLPSIQELKRNGWIRAAVIELIGRARCDRSRRTVGNVCAATSGATLFPRETDRKRNRGGTRKATRRGKFYIIISPGLLYWTTDSRRQSGGEHFDIFEYFGEDPIYGDREKVKKRAKESWQEERAMDPRVFSEEERGERAYVYGTRWW